jgi:hypothetical protein
MNMLIELDSDNRASLRRLFDRYPCLHGSVAAVIEGGMGRVFTGTQEEPSVALAVLDFHFLAGDPLHPHALLLFNLLQPGDVVIAPTPAWQHLVAATYTSALAVYPMRMTASWSGSNDPNAYRSYAVGRQTLVSRRCPQLSRRSDQWITLPLFLF